MVKLSHLARQKMTKSYVTHYVCPHVHEDAIISRCKIAGLPLYRTGMSLDMSPCLLTSDLKWMAPIS
jgi:hypothetical protein